MHNSDFLVIGAGPAGCTIAYLLKQQGFSVNLVEKATHPRFHIGESLLPYTLPILDKLGVSEQIKQIGIYKPGADFYLPNTTDQHAFYFAENLKKEPTHAYQVKRSEFDDILFRNCQKAGVNTFENTKITNVNLEDTDKVEATAVSLDQQLKFNAEFLIDATGRDTLMAKKLKTIQRNPEHASAAIYCHVKGASKNEGVDKGNIGIYWFEHGWMWFIPFSDGSASVGVVAKPNYFKQRKSSLKDFFWQSIHLAPKLQQRLQNSSMLTDVTATGNYSYLSKQMFGKNFLLLGDAFAFIDPVFSSGVHIAMAGAVKAAEVLGASFPNTSKKQLQQFETYMSSGIKTFSWLIYRMNQPAIKYLFMHPKNHLQIKSAVISLLAGDVFDHPVLYKKLRIFKIIYYLNCCRNLTANIRAYFNRIKAAK